MVVSYIYSEPPFFTNDEYESINGTPTNIQPPFIHKMPRFPSDDHQLLLHIPEQLNDRIELKHKIEDIDIIDFMLKVVIILFHNFKRCNKK